LPRPPLTTTTRWSRSKTNGGPRNRQLDTGNLERPAPGLTDGYDARERGDQRYVRHPGAEALGDPLAEPDGGEGGLDGLVVRRWIQCSASMSGCVWLMAGCSVLRVRSSARCPRGQFPLCGPQHRRGPIGVALWRGGVAPIEACPRPGRGRRPPRREGA